MPNGHGGYVRFFSVIVLVILTGGLLAYIKRGGWPGAVYVGYPLVILIGERLAFHLHMWKVDEYGGAYASDEEKALARGKYLIGAVIYAFAVAIAWYFVT